MKVSAETCSERRKTSPAYNSFIGNDMFFGSGTEWRTSDDVMRVIVDDDGAVMYESAEWSDC